MAAEKQMEDRAKQQGKLTIFASYFSGAGKSYAMLKAAERAKEAGVDVVIGLSPSEQWPETRELVALFEKIPGKTERPDGRTDDEINLDACLKRLPQLMVVDELSHRNGDNSRHWKRYQDIEELLKAGVDVYTTLDIQHIESIQDSVVSILNAPVLERIPDRVFDRAAQVEFIDIEPERLQQRLLQHKKGALLSSCSLSQLSALREIGLRRCADRAAMYTQANHSQTGYRTHEHILVCLSSAPSNEKIIRTAARMAGAFRCGFTALFVETKDFQWITPADKERLQANIHLAQQLGAVIETVYGDDVAYQIAEFSRLSGVTKIVLGRSGVPRPWLGKASLTERLIELTPELDIHIIPDNGSNKHFSSKHWEIMHMPAISVLDLLKSISILILTTVIGFLFYNWGFTEANIITLYILGGMLVSVSTKSSICSFIASIVSVLTFNFFFTEPRFSLHAYDSGYPVTFLIMFLASLITGSLASRLKSHAKRSAQVAWRTKLLFETDQNLQKARSQEEIISVTARQLLKIFQRDIVAYRVQQDELVGPEIFVLDQSTPTDSYTTQKEQEVAKWVLTNNKRAGAGTETLSDACCTYLSVRTGKQVYGVVGIAALDKPLDSFETSILFSVLGECALALENQKNLEEKEAAAVLAKNEQLRANLLRSISHDLRTPLTSISGNASNLLSNGTLFDEKTKEEMYTDIYDDAMWLINLVENLLSVSRLEDGRMNLRISTELMDEIVAEALRHINRKSVEYQINVQSSEEYLLVQVDAKLIIQVIINIVDNAIKYTPPGSEIDIGWRKQGNFIYVSVADNGPGISDQAKPHIFDMFYSAANPIADSRRSMGLGLALCKSIVNAHGGEINVTDHLPHGCVFTFSVPAGEVELHE
ncbi:sensor histidine kinase KdpD [Pseudoflavonifractor sp. AF19-9AC]|uniref:sensor histidine kinase n=1 Tax=Pseudoflavonifractor sp. AF19-9AC TaxID=2292244 RepID=UPI000E52E4BC|nr:sensor histidine kinase KdpD [Pseudoflavonifractor sp. AF19-9AC]RHR04844.1 sensor histidine kinase KdpD [Pseudoflavonifractor sp. AF19-9AC]